MSYFVSLPTAANVPPISVTVRNEYFTDKMLETGPVKKIIFDFYIFHKYIQ